MVGNKLERHQICFSGRIKAADLAEWKKKFKSLKLIHHTSVMNKAK